MRRDASLVEVVEWMNLSECAGSVREAPPDENNSNQGESGKHLESWRLIGRSWYPSQLVFSEQGSINLISEGLVDLGYRRMLSEFSTRFDTQLGFAGGSDLSLQPT